MNVDKQVMKLLKNYKLNCSTIKYMIKQPWHKIMFIVLGLLSILWWAFLAYQSLTYTPVCSSDDELCLSAQTVAGDLSSSAAFAIFTLIPVWGGALIVYLASRFVKGDSRSARVMRRSIYGIVALLMAALLLAWL